MSDTPAGAPGSQDRIRASPGYIVATVYVN